ncbi:MAG TPA: hypothetical protein VKT99_19365 [Xanthobacteraceae bacterium]|jgi:hypothetical protein|nr:hypothetical protein [Xanthobacteraceae bacterium]
MTLFSPTVLYPPVATRDRPASADIAFGVWASIILIGLAILSVALGVAPVADPSAFTLS